MMHTPEDRPACWTATLREPSGPHMDAFWDKGRACGNFRTAEDEAAALHLTPTCAGCARAQRARDLREASV
jgi:hypothetical protein